MGIYKKKLEVFQTSSVGFNGQKTIMLTHIQLPVIASTKTKLVDFQVRHPFCLQCHSKETLDAFVERSTIILP